MDIKLLEETIELITSLDMKVELKYKEQRELDKIVSKLQEELFKLRNK